MSDEIGRCGVKHERRGFHPVRVFMKKRYTVMSQQMEIFITKQSQQGRPRRNGKTVVGRFKNR